MRDKNLGSAFIIAISILLLGVIIFFSLFKIFSLFRPNVKYAIPSELIVELKEQQTQNQEKQYLYMDEASSYLRIDMSYFEELFNAGSLEGTYVKVNDQNIFIKELLDEWMRAQIDNH